MNQDIQLSQGGAVPPVPAPTDPFGVPYASGNTAPPVSPFVKMHRLLRGRYGIALSLALGGALIGGVAGWLSQTKQYKSVGLVNITPTLPNTGEGGDYVMPMYQAFVQAQSTLMTSDRVLQAAAKTMIANDIWKQQYRSPSLEDTVAALSDRLTVSTGRGSPLIQITFTDRRADVAKVAVAAVINAYMGAYGNTASQSLNNKIKYLEDKRLQINSQINADKATVTNLAQKYGTENLDTLLSAKTEEFLKYDGMVSQTEIRLREAENAGVATPKPMKENEPVPAATIDAIAAADVGVRGLVSERNHGDMQVARLLRIYGANHRLVREAQADRDDAEARLQATARRFLANNMNIRFSLEGEATAVTPAELVQLKKAYETVKAVRDRESQAIADIARQRSEIQSKQFDIATKQASLRDINRDYEGLTAQQQLANQVTVLSDGNTPTAPAVDKGAQYAMAGVMGGALVPLGLMLLYGLVDHRFRYSDEAGGELSGITLLGILPNLPDRLSDPEQASTAAHCVHQIRTMLQINQPAGEPHAISITSATSGDGKTSLTLALGLSYAACGTRVLLIDCDLVGAGLSHRMNIDSPEGVLEAIANRGLLEYVRTTDINDVAILPVGMSGQHHASTLSPQSLRRLITEAKQYYDMILIDTGPILGSIEASLVCTAVDGVVLTVARGQQRPMVEKSLNHLVSIGARLAGVVFNRAQGADFTNSISGMSARNQRAKAGQFGPVARAVASSYKAGSNGHG